MRASLASRLTLLAIGGLLLATPARAGSESEPELTDETGDTFVYPTASGTGPIADAMDLVAVWLEEKPDAVRFTMKVVDLGALVVTETNPAGDGRWWVEFSVAQPDGTLSGDETPWEARVFVSQGAVWQTQFTLTDPSQDRLEVDGGFDVSTNLLWVDAPKAALGLTEGGRILDLYSRTGTYFPAYPSWIGDDGTSDQESSFALESPAGPQAAAAPADEPDRRGVPTAQGPVVIAALAALALWRRRA